MTQIRQRLDDAQAMLAGFVGGSILLLLGMFLVFPSMSPQGQKFTLFMVGVCVILILGALFNLLLQSRKIKRESGG